MIIETLVKTYDAVESLRKGETHEDRMHAAVKECQSGDADRQAITRECKPLSGRVTRFALRRRLSVRDGTDGTAA